MRAKARRVLSVSYRGGVSYRGNKGCWWAEEQWGWGCHHFGAERNMSPLGAEVGQGDWSGCTQNLRITPWINVLDSPTVSSNALSSMTSTNFWVHCTENIMLLIASGVYISGSLWFCKSNYHRCHKCSLHSFHVLPVDFLPNWCQWSLWAHLPEFLPIKCVLAPYTVEVVVPTWLPSGLVSA